MARPQKFRYQREELTDPKVAEKLGRFVIEIEDLREQRSKLDEMLAAAYDAVDDAGFEKKFVRKVVALRAKEEGARRDEEDGLETYEYAVTKGVSLARTRSKPAKEEFDPVTGEFLDDDHTASDDTPIVHPSPAESEAEEISAIQFQAKASGEQTERTTGHDEGAGSRREMRVGEAGRDYQPATSDDGRDGVERHAPNQPETATRRVDGFGSVQDALKMSTNGPNADVAEQQNDTVKADDMSLTVVGTESGTVANSEMDRATEGSFETGSEAAEKGRKAIPASPEGVDLNHAGAGESPATESIAVQVAEEATTEPKAKVESDPEQSVQIRRLRFPLAPASQGEAEAPSAERVTPHRSGSAAANAGGDHVNAHQSSAATAGAAVSAAPAKKTIRDYRPHCLRPRACGSSKIDEHCHSCRKAMEAGEAA